MSTITAIPYQANTETLFNLIRKLPYACWLDSGKPHSNYGRYDIISALPSARIVTCGKKTKLYQRDSANKKDHIVSEHQSDPLSLVEMEVNKLTTHGISELPFIGGAIGYFGYDLSQHYINSDYSSTSTNTLPDMHMGIYHWAIVQDHKLKAAYLAYLPECHPDIIRVIEQHLDKSPLTDQTAPLSVKKLSQCISRGEYMQQLDRIKQYILSGDCYQVNFAQCFEGHYTGDPYSAYSELRTTMASPFSAYLNMGDQAILSLSPERFLQTQGRRVLTQPIKGTAPRGLTPKEDTKNAHDLQASEKNRAENLMIVDLLRNDIGHHCIPGSIKATSLFELQSFPNVHHLVSNITGTLTGQASSIDLLRDCFPGGSITGAPKKRAMEIIKELENRNREVYCGSIGYINNNGDMDTNIAIRTVSCDGSKLYCWGGGGIVADSNPNDEYQESLNKINAILAVLGAANTPKE